MGLVDMVRLFAKVDSTGIRGYSTTRRPQNHNIPPMFFILVELWFAQAKSLPAAGRPVPLVAPFGTQGKRDRHAS